MKLDPKQQLEQAKERVIDTIAQNMNLYGITDSVGRLFGLLFFSKNPMTLDEMKEELGMSKTSMSTSVRSLMDLKMVDKVWKKGVRKDLYQAEEDWYQTFIDLFSIKWRPAISMNVSAIEKSKKELQLLLGQEDIDSDIRTEAEMMIEKLNACLDYYQWLTRLVDSFESHEIFNFIPKNEKKEK
ncbi:GbsR/MarR family transcriptional regulator [Calidifontibacillus erzurumensis]|uniref:HTH-type transcriptional regulator n=1 Tax=Calidifontibacillus erzurumensis TaxID=2741433 RepID=A0A8J8KCB3_9BACI|nr:GbsR/MarR family transcriptional regulator [Calidifontibacillus erzurumensis]NSL52447.1 GbsR/MarR family transcriptional regulator [Calidifontibacillus erzurumensis]